MTIQNKLIKILNKAEIPFEKTETYIGSVILFSVGKYFFNCTNPTNEASMKKCFIVDMFTSKKYTFNNIKLIIMSEIMDNIRFHFTQMKCCSKRCTFNLKCENCSTNQTCYHYNEFQNEIKKHTNIGGNKK